MLHGPSSETKTEATQSKAASEPLLTREQHPPLAGRAKAQRPGGMSNQMLLRLSAAQRRQQAAGAQQTYGNQRALRLLRHASASGGLLQRKCACGGSSGADSECAECKAHEAALQRAPAHTPSPALPQTAPPIVHEVLRSPGQPLDAGTRAFMEPRFGADFSGVRVHTDARAAASARAINALAYTVGREVVFGVGQYAPETNMGKHLLAHELTHVIQQGRGGTAPLTPHHTHTLEQAAHHAASIITQGGTTTVTGSSAPGIARQSIGAHGGTSHKPLSLEKELNPKEMSVNELEEELAAINEWELLNPNPVPTISPETELLEAARHKIEVELKIKKGQQNPAPTAPGQGQATARVATSAQGGIAPRPRSYEQNLDPTRQSDEELEEEIAAIKRLKHDYPDVNHDDLEIPLYQLQEEVKRRKQQLNLDRQQGTVTLSGAPDLSSSEVPASYTIDGLPAIHYKFLNKPLGTIDILTPSVTLHIEPFIKGEVTLTFGHSPSPQLDITRRIDSKPKATDTTRGVDSKPKATHDVTLQWHAKHALDSLFAGLKISGLGSKQISVGGTFGNQYFQNEIRFIPPNTFANIFQILFSKSIDTARGPVVAQGQLGFEVRVTPRPNLPIPSEPVPEPVDEESWFSQHAGELALLAAAGIVLVIVAPEALPTLIPVAEEMAEAE